MTTKQVIRLVWQIWQSAFLNKKKVVFECYKKNLPNIAWILGGYFFLKIFENFLTIF